MELGSLTAWGPILLGVMIALTVALKWPTRLHYLWSALAILWGVISLI